MDFPSLQSALAIITEVATHVNEEVRRAENQRRVEEIQQKGASCLHKTSLTRQV